jgi:hypothetical protein
MLLRFTLGAAGAMVLASTATAQNVSGNLQPITSPVKDAGTYHMATGTWTRAKSSVALAGPETIYDNTCTVGYFTGMDPSEIVADSGRIPGLGSGGSADNYTVNGFELAYCSYEAGGVTLLNPYWDCYAACSGGGSLSAITPVAAFSLVSMPAGGAAGSQGCWAVTFDLANSTFTFALAGDCNGTYDNNASTDSFGWGFGTPAALNGTVGTGPFLAGDPALAFNPSCGGVGDGTTFAGFNPALPGTGIGQLDQFELQSLTVTSGCYWFGGYSGSNGAAGAGTNPFSGFYMELQGEGGGGGFDSGSADCDCDGGNSPCFNVSGVGRGCPNSGNASGAALVGSGNPSVNNDTFSLATSGAALSKPGLILSGTVSLGPDGVASVPDNAGVLCVGGATRRGDVVFTDAAGDASFPDFQGAAYGASDIVNVGSGVSYTHWFRDPGTAAGCLNDGAGADFNFSNGWTATWTL